MTSNRVLAAEAYVKALRTGEGSAAEQAATHLADDVVLASGADEVRGRASVLRRISGQWPLTPTLLHAGFSTPREDNGQVTVSGELPPLGAAPRALRLVFSFNAADQITRTQDPEEVHR
jgi:hypothetical protein